jgi:hypothetical protein
MSNLQESQSELGEELQEHKEEWEVCAQSRSWEAAVDGGVMGMLEWSRVRQMGTTGNCSDGQ